MAAAGSARRCAAVPPGAVALARFLQEACRGRGHTNGPQKMYGK